MALPKHNPALKGAYLLSVLGMFAFMMLVINVYWPHDMANAKNNETTSTSTHEMTSTKPSAKTPKAPHAKTRMTPKDTLKNVLDPVAHRSKKIVAGLSYSLDLSRDVTSQMNGMWREFYNAEDIGRSLGVKNTRKVYVVYGKHDEESNTILMVIGFLVKSDRSIPATYKTVVMKRGAYLQRRSVLDVWQSATTLPVYLKYENDYEVYTLDRDFNILTQMAFIGFNE